MPVQEKIGNQKVAASDLVKWLLGILAFLICTGVSAMGGAVWSHESRIIKNEMAAVSMETAILQSKIAIDVAAQHGDEMQLLRKDVATVRHELVSSLAVLTELINKSSRDRYFKVDAENDRLAIEAKIQNLDIKLQELIDSLTTAAN